MHGGQETDCEGFIWHAISSLHSSFSISVIVSNCLLAAASLAAFKLLVPIPSLLIHSLPLPLSLFFLWHTFSVCLSFLLLVASFVLPICLLMFNFVSSITLKYCLCVDWQGKKLVHNSFTFPLVPTLLVCVFLFFS